MGVKGLNVRDRYATKARDEHAIKLDKVLYILIALVNIKTSKYLSKKKRSLKQSSRLKKNKQILRFFWYRNIRMVRITVIWMSMKYKNFFSFPKVTYAYPQHAVNVPFISSHIKVSRSSLEPNLSTWQFYFPCGLVFFKLFFLTWSWSQFFF